MQRLKPRAILMLAFAVCLAWILFYFVILPKTSIYYRSPEVSAVIVDAYSGQPIEGARVQVNWGALRPRGWHGSDSMDIHTADATTDKDGHFTIPAWGPIAVAREWRCYEFDPTVSFSKPGYNPGNEGNRDNQDSVTSGVIPFLTVTLRLPSWAGNNLELTSLTNSRLVSSTNTLSRMSDAVLSNSLTYYVVREQMVEGGRFIDTPDFPGVGYIRPEPDSIIMQIQSFSTNIGKDLLYGNWHVMGIPAEQSWASGFSITLFKEDAIKVAELNRKNIAKRDLLYMLGNQPLAQCYMAMNASDSASIQLPTGPQTIYLPLRNHQNLQEINKALQKLVRHK